MWMVVCAASNLIAKANRRGGLFGRAREG